MGEELLNAHWDIATHELVQRFLLHVRICVDHDDGDEDDGPERTPTARWYGVRYEVRLDELYLAGASREQLAARGLTTYARATARHGVGCTAGQLMDERPPPLRGYYWTGTHYERLAR